MYRIDAKVMEVSSIHKTAKKEEIFYFVDDTSRVKNIVREKNFTNQHPAADFVRFKTKDV